MMMDNFPIPDVIERLVEAAEEISGLKATQEEIREIFRQALTGNSPSDSQKTSE